MSSSRKPLSLNKLYLHAPVWLASDIHLNESNPLTAHAFYAMLDRASQHASALILLGDVFDVWVGDDAAVKPEPWLAQTIQALAACAQRIPVYLCVGNRDFLIGPTLARQLNLHLLGEQTQLVVGQTTVLISHGDEYCTDDQSYQRFKRWVRQPWLQGLFKQLSLGRRLKIAAKARAQSQAKQSLIGYQADIMDVTPATVERTFITQQVKHIVHGHTHRPGHYRHTIGGQIYERWVLPDWEFDSPIHETPRGGFISIDQHSITCHPITQ